jgi:N-acetylneuraminate synthase
MRERQHDASSEETMSKVFIIAEAGVNHNGSLEMALRLVDAAKASGADAVKFQSFQADLLATRFAHKAAYQERTVPASDSQLEMLRRLQLDAEAHRHIIERCNEIGIEFLSSPFDPASADLLESLHLRIFKIPSGEITNIPFLEHLARKGKPLIVSTGMSTLGEVEAAVNAIAKIRAVPLTLLQCVTEYPAPYNAVNLRAMLTLKQAFCVPVGYSDHTSGIEIAIAAVAIGAEVIEKHFTLSRSLPGPDHAASLEPDELKTMVTAIRHVEEALGDGIKAPSACEFSNIAVARKSVVARCALPKGHVLSAKDLTVKRPGTGLPPNLIGSLVGRTLRMDIEQDEVIGWAQLN